MELTFIITIRRVLLLMNKSEALNNVKASSVPYYSMMAYIHCLIYTLTDKGHIKEENILRLLLLHLDQVGHPHLPCYSSSERKKIK